MASNSILGSPTSVTPLAIGMGIGALFLSYLAVSTFLTWYRLRSFPGPFLASFSYLWLLRADISGDNGRIRHEMSKKYGPVTRIGPRELLVSDIDQIKRSTGARGTYKRSVWYRDTRVNPYHPMVFNLMDTAEHDRRKAKLMVGYSGRDNLSMEAEIDGVVREFVACVRDRYAAAPFRPLDLATYTSYFTLDAISKVAYGKSFGYLARGDDIHGYLKTMRTTLPTMPATSDIPALGSFFGSTFFLNLFGPKITDKRGFGVLMK